jgi:3-keto-disaccharide hydrolase
MARHTVPALAFALLSVLLVPALGAQETAKPPAAKPSAAAQAGWTNLFDGKTLNGWRGYKKPDAKESRWAVEDGMLTLPKNDGKDTRGARDIISTGTYDQFELEWEWKIALAGNSGMKYFVLEDMDSAIGHEYQLIDDERHPDAKVGPKRQTAALYDVLAAANRPLKPAGEWNTSRIVVRGTTVEHWLNGTKVLTYELGSPALKAAVAESKFKDVARFGTPQKGHILVQDHGDQVWFKSIRIRPLTGGATTAPAAKTGGR